MANPQKENGFTPLANELLEAFGRIRISGESRQIVDVIIRKTYGFNKKEDAIALSQFCLATGMKKNSVCKAINNAVILNVITKKVNGTITLYRLNKDFETWKPLPKKVTHTQKSESTVPKKVNKRTQKSDIQKTKDIPTKDKDQPTLSADVPVLIDLFQILNPAYKKLFGSPPQRKAADNLLKLHPFDWWKRFMPAYQVALEDRFCPRATTPVQMENKIGEIDIYGRQRKKAQENPKHKVAF